MIGNTKRAKWIVETLDDVCPTWRLSRADGSPYLDRSVLWGADCLDAHDCEAPTHAFVHRIYGPDADRHMHDHPWAWAVAIPLEGGYREHRPTHGGAAFTSHVYRVGDLNILRPGDYHSIVDVLPDTTTLFLCGREVSDWGFLVDGVHVPHGDYFKRDDVQRMTHARLR